MPQSLHLVLLFHCLACGVGVSWEHSRSSSMCSPSAQQLHEQERKNIFLRNCSSPDMQQPPLLVPPPSSDHVEALSHVLYNRTVAFIGDSTMQSQVSTISVDGANINCVYASVCACVLFIEVLTRLSHIMSVRLSCLNCTHI